MKKIYYIECTTSETRSVIKGYFETSEDAKHALKSCSNWFGPNNTGKIYSKELGLNGKLELVMDKTYYVMKDGHCLNKFDNEENATKYAKKVGGIVTEYTNKYDIYYETLIF